MKKPTITTCKRYRELPVEGGGVMRAEAGDKIVKFPNGVVEVMPPSRFAAVFPELVK